MARRAFVFDLDGTIWDSRPWYVEILVTAGLPDAAALLGSGTPVARLIRNTGLQPQFAVTSEAQHLSLNVFSEVVEVLERLGGSGHALAAVTNLPSWMAIPMLKATGLASHFAFVRAWSRGGKARHLARLRDDLGTCEQWWYVGDEVEDATAARRAGYEFAWASWGYGEEPPNADAILHQPKDLLAL